MTDILELARKSGATVEDASNTPAFPRTRTTFPDKSALAAFTEAARQEERERAEQDARRYRWLRDLSPGKNNRWPHIGIYPWHTGIDGPMQRLPVFDLAGYHPERLDEWIDAALAQPEPGGTTGGRE